jgi:hypothetical protein
MFSHVLRTYPQHVQTHLMSKAPLVQFSEFLREAVAARHAVAAEQPE